MPYTYEYPRLMLTVDAVVFRRNEKQLEVLLIQRKFDPYKDMWALPGGFVDMEETVEEAIKRELEEETGLFMDNLRQLHTFSALGRDPRGRTVSVTFWGITDMDNSTVKGGDDAENARWFAISNIPPLAFDHIQAVEMAISRINNLQYI